MKRFLVALVLVGAGSSVFAQAFNEGFEDVTDSNGDSSLTALNSRGWAEINNSSPQGTTSWFGDSSATSNEPFAAHSGSSFIAANVDSTGTSGTISTWLLTPEVTLHNGDTFSFYTRTINNDYADNLEVRLSTSGTSSNVGSSATTTGDFGTLLLSVNPTQSATGYPAAWTLETVTVSGLSSSGASGRFGLRYYLTDAGSGAANGNFVGVDDVAYTPNPVPEPTTLAALGMGALAFFRRRKRTA